MSTRSNIRIIRKDGSRTGIYCHSDGYIEYNGMMLQLFYNTKEKVEELLKEGDLSSLAPTIEDTLSYVKWRNEEFRQSWQDEEFNYTFIERLGVWIVSHELEYEYYENEFLDVQMSYVPLKWENLLLNKLEEYLQDSFGFFKQYCQKYMGKEIIDEYELMELFKEKAMEGRKEAIIEA
jgi:hypothetical protein